MSCSLEILACIQPAANFSYLARMQSDTGEELLQADADSISWESFDEADTATVVASGSLAIADTIFDTLVTDRKWGGHDLSGYNFLMRVPSTACPQPSKTYRIQIEIQLTGGGNLRRAFRFQTQAWY